MIRRLAATALACAVFATLALAGAGTASAHAIRMAADPAPDSSVDTGPPRASAVASVALRPLGPTGRYTVNYRVTSADGHVVNGAWSFDLTVAGTGTPGPKVAQSADEPDGVPVWPFVAVAAVIVGAGAWLAVRRRR
jgi:methionine-rich copper-binding protein CopC